MRAARTHDGAARVPWTVNGVPAGAVLRAHRDVLRRWPQWLRVDGEGDGDTVDLALPPAQRDVALATVNAALREAVLVRGWRDEIFAVPSLRDGVELARTERAAARFWGSLTLGAHANGVVAGRDGRPAALWLAQRSPHKTVDPGRWDNLVGGGVPAGQSTWQALVREAGEEAGLAECDWQRAAPGRAVTLLCDVVDGLQRERIDSWDLWLPARWRPCNRDGEVQRFECLPFADALALAAGGAMTVDAALVTLDFGLRHDLLAPPPGSDAVFAGPVIDPR